MSSKNKKPLIKLVGEDGNIFNLLGIETKALRRAGQVDNAKLLSDKIFSCGSYDEALNLIMQFCEVQDPNLIYDEGEGNAEDDV